MSEPLVYRVAEPEGRRSRSGEQVDQSTTVQNVVYEILWPSQRAQAFIKKFGNSIISQVTTTQHS
jgi:hypothetical protein